MFEKELAAMPSPENFSSRKEWEAACWRKISESKELLQLLVTSHERRDIVRRAIALQQIVSGKSYRQIGKELWLSPQTVSVLKKAVSEKSYRSYLERSKKERKKKKYSPDLTPTKSKPPGRPHRTKYGTVYLPY
jgi:hypothetical protein